MAVQCQKPTKQQQLNTALGYNNIQIRNQQTRTSLTVRLYEHKHLFCVPLTLMKATLLIQQLIVMSLMSRIFGFIWDLPQVLHLLSIHCPDEFWIPQKSLPFHILIRGGQ